MVFADSLLSGVIGTKQRCICGVLSSMWTTAERIFFSPTRSEMKSRAIVKYAFCSSGGNWFINSGEAVISVSTIITLSFLVLHPASATMRLISFL